MAGLEPARAFYGPTDFKSVASAISPHRHIVVNVTLTIKLLSKRILSLTPY
jgi:hypothetical protein